MTTGLTDEFIIAEKYLNNELDPENKQWIEERLNYDSSLAKEIQLHRVANELVIEMELIKLRERISELINRKERIKNIKRTVIRSVFIVTPAIFLAGLWYTRNSK
ncbi:MAG: hypothetical protein ACK4ND_00115 [Cytophagaceae bacterium]